MEDDSDLVFPIIVIFNIVSVFHNYYLHPLELCYRNPSLLSAQQQISPYFSGCL